MVMKIIRYGVLIFSSGLVGFLLSGLLLASNNSAERSSAGQTVHDVGRAIQELKSKTGEWPDSLDSLMIKSKSGEFSDKLFNKLHYYKTEQGYVIFIGVSDICYSDEPGAVRHGEMPRARAPE